MKTKTLLACLFVAGIAASFAIASPPPGKGKPNQGAASTGSTTAASGKGKADKVALCHRTGSKSHPYQRILVAKSAVKAHIKRGDLAPSADGSCPKGTKPGGGGETTTGTNTDTTTATTTPAP